MTFDGIGHTGCFAQTTCRFSVSFSQSDSLLPCLSNVPNPYSLKDVECRYLVIECVRVDRRSAFLLSDELLS